MRAAVYLLLFFRGSKGGTHTSIDWKEQNRKDKISAVMVDPHNLDSTRGELENLILSGSSISFSYDSDTRVTAKLRTFGSNYVPGSWIRIIHSVGDEYQNELGTFILQNDPSYTFENNQMIYEYTLQSVLWGLSNDLTSTHFSIGEGAYSLAVFDKICSVCEKTGQHNPGARNYRYNNSKIYPIGDSFLSFLFDVCDSSNNRLDVDGHGRITIGPYTPPSEISASWEEDSSSEDTLLIADSIEYSSSSENIPGRTIVVYTNGDTEISATATLPASSPYSPEQRGYTIAKTYQVNDLKDPTKSQLSQMARDYLDETKLVNEINPSFLYFPCKCGETINLAIDHIKKKWLFYSIDLDLETMHINTTLKEVQ